MNPFDFSAAALKTKKLDVPKFNSIDGLKNNIPNFRDVKENRPLGGLYGELKSSWRGYNMDAHHMPAASANGLERNYGPAIIMERSDHRRTASFGSSMEAKQYRAKQDALIKGNKFNNALNMDIQDIHAKFGSKYNIGIRQMMDVCRSRGYIK